jgi:hypothetical protein
LVKLIRGSKANRKIIVSESLKEFAKICQWVAGRDQHGEHASDDQRQLSWRIPGGPDKMGLNLHVGQVGEFPHADF